MTIAAYLYVGHAKQTRAAVRAGSAEPGGVRTRATTIVQQCKYHSVPQYKEGFDRIVVPKRSLHSRIEWYMSSDASDREAFYLPWIRTSARAAALRAPTNKAAENAAPGLQKFGSRYIIPVSHKGCLQLRRSNYMPDSWRCRTWSRVGRYTCASKRFTRVHV